MDPIPTPPAASTIPPATIRPFTSSTDLKVTRFLVGSSIIEPSALANLAALWSPFSLLMWLLLTHLLITRFTPGWPNVLVMLFSGRGLHWWNTWSWDTWANGLREWLTVVPVCVAPPIVLLAGYELRHRNMFEEEMARAIGEEDLRDVEEYYSTRELLDAKKKKKVASVGTEAGGRRGFWVLEYDSRIIAAFGIDGRKAAMILDSVTDHPVVSTSEDEPVPSSDDSTAISTGTPSSPYPLRNRTTAASTTPPSKVVSKSPASPEISPITSDPSILHLRRFATSLSFRSVDIEDDLLAYASTFAFAPSPPGSPSQAPAEKLLYTLRPSIQKELLKRILKAGYVVVEKGSTLEVKVEEQEKGALWWRVVEGVWPLDLGWRTYVLERKSWEKRNK